MNGQVAVKAEDREPAWESGASPWGVRRHNGGMLRVLLPLFEPTQDRMVAQEMAGLAGAMWDIVRSETRADSLWLLQVDEGRHCFIPQATFGAAAAGRGLGMIEALARWLVKTGQPLCLRRGPWLDPELSLGLRRAGVASVLGVPVIGEGKVSGVLACSCSRLKPSLGDRDVEILYVLARQVAMVLENRHLLHQVRERQSQVEKLFQETAAAQEKERQRISLELHDGAAQWMLAAGHRLQNLRQSIPGSAGKLSEVEHILDQGIQELRWVILDLQPPVVEMGLCPAILAMLQKLSQLTGLQGHLRVEGEARPLPHSREVMVYRIVQEALSNVRKHARAGQVWVALHFQDREVVAEIKDDGRGFAPATIDQVAPAGRLGVKGMRERAESLGGSLEIQSSPGAGTTVSLRFPCSG